MKKRVLHFIGSFHQGGSERQAINLMKLLHDEGPFGVFAATLNNEGVLRREIDAIGLPKIPEFRLNSFYSANFVQQVRKCAKYLRDNEIDIVHTHDFYTNVFGLAAARLARVPVRITSKRETSGMRSGAQRVVEKLAFGQSDVVVVNSLAVRDYLITSGIEKEKLRVIYNGINADLFNTIQCDREHLCQKYGLPNNENDRLVTLVANLRHEVKNVPMLLRVARRILEERSDVHFVIAGEGELEAELIETAKNLNIHKNVHLIGRCNDVPQLLAMSYACVLTSNAEGFSNSILEYMAAGKPVVATNVGGAAEAVIDDETGFLVASDDDKAMADRLNDLLDNDTKASDFGASGRRIVEDKFSQDTQRRSTIGLYNSLLK